MKLREQGTSMCGGVSQSSSFQATENHFSVAFLFHTYQKSVMLYSRIVPVCDQNMMFVSALGCLYLPP